MERAGDLVEAHYLRFVAGLVLFYATVELIYAIRLPLVMDEFDGAYEVYRLLRELPYRDYAPYKTVLGYYLNLPAAILASEVWQRILLLKTELVLINVVALTAAAVFLRRVVSGAAVVLALALLIVNTAFLERSGELRVDMLTAWAGLASLLLLLAGRPAWAGAACGAGFCISQKAAFYFAATNAAMAAELLRSRTRRALSDLLVFNAAFGMTLGIYVGFWSLFSSSVVRTTFLSALGAGTVPAYGIRMRFWTQIIARNPMYFVITAAALTVLAVSVIRGRGGRRHLLVLVFAAAVLAQMIVYSQPWPYHFVIMLPTIFVLHAVHFDSARTPQRPFGLPALFLLGTIGLGILYPASRIPVAMARDNSYQQYNVRLASAVLEPGDTYLAGTDIVHDHEQTLPALQRLGAPPLAELRAASPEVTTALVNALAETPPKLVVGNYRVYRMPQILLRFIDAHYSRISGSILLYAPLAEPGISTVRIAFGGRYILDTKSPSRLTVDAEEYASGSTLQLTAGIHRIGSEQPVRLRLLPQGIEQVLDGRYTEEQDFYPNVYDY